MRDGVEAISYYHADHLGGTNIITDSSGVQTKRLEYTPFGSTYLAQGTSQTNYQYTGKESDPTGLYYYGARYYDPELGRFIQADTIVPVISNPQTLNRYSYADNNPINNIDPTGHWSWKKFFGSFLGGIVSAAVAIVAAPLGVILAGTLAGAAGGAATAAMSGGDIVKGALFGAAFGFGTAALGAAASSIPEYGGIARQIYDSSVVIASGAIGISQNGPEGFLGGVFGSGLVTGIASGFSYGQASTLTEAPQPQGFWDTALDILSFSYSLNQYVKNPNWKTGIGLFADTLALLAPGVPGGAGIVGKALSKADDIGDARKAIKVIGRQQDTAVAKGWSGHDVLDLPKGKWTPQKNALWIDEGIKNRQPFYKASPETTSNIWKSGTTKTVYGQELDQIRAAGYKDVGDYLLP